ncbi:hypothetical protein [Campylobacter ureolyticus]|uniref:hypothetical protein n=1 Tax=Campylobacter ureolyticus TaxID=827 RepID=UPI0020512AA6|nr:hypothetical protein [Campylobacter ureolyticus]MCZ6116874.1 hypothetical protein [Campylobacter ureolyticus]DAR64072.1 MAG TPA: type VI secretion protein [Caudoviricetes sp.]
MNEKIIPQSSDFINASKEWAFNEFIVFFVLLFVIIMLIVFYFSQKSSTKFSDKLLDVMEKNTQGYEKLSHSIDLQNTTNLETLNRLDRGISESLKMHETTHNDLSDLKKIVLSRRLNDE